jgi:formiminoglutamase
MHRDASAAGIGVWTAADVRREGILTIVDAALARLDGMSRIMIDFDIDVIDRSQFPGAPGARPGGITASEFFCAARDAAAHPKVALVDLTEFDPSLDPTDLSALTAGRWVAEILAGFSSRPAE